MYATVQDMRVEGVREEDASNERVADALLDAGAVIDRATGWFFEPRTMGFGLSGRRSPVLELPVPPIRITQVRVNGECLSPDEFTVTGVPLQDGPYCSPRLVWHRDFPRGADNVWVAGRWGYTVPCEGVRYGATPRPVRRAAMLLAMQYLPPLSTDGAGQARDQWRIIEERTRDQSYRLDPRADGPLTGNPEVDALLLPYRRPMALGAA